MAKLRKREISKTIRSPRAAPRGVTLVEIAIVLVIIGLLLGGVLKGQELINNAKVRSIADRQTSLKVAWYSFITRFGAMPGDYIYAEQYIPGAGRAQNHTTGDGIIVQDESPLALQNLTGAGFLRCSQCTAQDDGRAPSSANSLVNSYGGVMAVYTNNYTAPNAMATQTYALNDIVAGQPRLMTHSGARLPSNIAAEVDRKIDDGIANEGDVVFNTFDPTATQIPDLSCMTSDTTKQVAPMALNFNGQLWWRHADSSVEQNCGLSLHL